MFYIGLGSLETWAASHFGGKTLLFFFEKLYRPLKQKEVGEAFDLLSFQSPPYTMIKKDAASKRRRGNDRFEGFVVDLANEIARIVGFNFTLLPTQGYGSKGDDGQWNGMIRELLEEVRGGYPPFVRRRHNRA